MADQNHSDVLNGLLVRLYRSLLQYGVECCSAWTSSAQAHEQQALEQMAARQRESVARLVDLLTARGLVVDFGNYDDYSELHYVSLKFLLGKLIENEQQLIAALESGLAALGHDPEATKLVSDVLAAEKDNLTRLGGMARAQATVHA
jgi:hypothetical protein